MQPNIIWSRVLIAIIIVAGIAAASHFFIRRFPLAILLNVLVATSAVALLRTGGPWTWEDFKPLAVVAGIVLVISLLTGLPFAISRKRRLKSARGFDVVT